MGVAPSQSFKAKRIGNDSATSLPQLQALDKMGVAPSEYFNQRSRHGKSDSESFQVKHIGNGSATSASGGVDAEAKNKTKIHTSFSLVGKAIRQASAKVSP